MDAGSARPVPRDHALSQSEGLRAAPKACRRSNGHPFSLRRNGRPSPALDGLLTRPLRARQEGGEKTAGGRSALRGEPQKLDSFFFFLFGLLSTPYNYQSWRDRLSSML